MGLSNEQAENARRRLTAMQNSGVSAQITREQLEQRQAEKDFAKATQQRQEANYIKDREVLAKMLFLMRGIKEIQESLPVAQRDLSYSGNKKVAKAIIGTQPKAHRIGELVATPIDYINNPVPTALTSAAGALAKKTNLPAINKVAGGAKDVYSAVNSVNGAVGIFSPAASHATHLSDISNSSIVQHCLSWWGVTSVQPYLPLLRLTAPIAAGVAVWNVNSTLDPLLALWARYDNACSCCGPITQITDALQNKAANSAAMLNSFYAIYLTSRKLYDKVAHKLAKRGNVDLHRASYYIAEQLWSSARDVNSPNHRLLTQQFSTAHSSQHCPFALLALATLFGKGDADQGYPKAAAAVMSEKNGAIKKIRALLP